MNLDELIYISKNQLSKDFCDHCIEKFEQYKEYQFPGQTANGLDDIKISTDMIISSVDLWKEEDNTFFKSLSDNLKCYETFVPYSLRSHVMNGNPIDTGYQLQRTKAGERYKWHHDQLETRILTFIWYLNDIKEDGYTEFRSGLKIQPECGKILIFPALWPWVHRGFPPKSETKYICTGWIKDDRPVFY